MHGVEHRDEQRYLIIGVFYTSKRKAVKGHALGTMCDVYMPASFQHVGADTRACVPRVYQKNYVCTTELRKRE